LHYTVTARWRSWVSALVFPFAIDGAVRAV
jgi:hypothetical protein